MTDDGQNEDKNLKQIEAIGLVYGAVKDLGSEAAHSVLAYVNKMVAPDKALGKSRSSETQGGAGDKPPLANGNEEEIDENNSGDGIAAVALKWMRRNDLDSEGLSKVFSLGLEEIDLVAKKIPGTSKQQKLRSVFLLKGIAAYLASGTPKFSREQAKEACDHYDAWDKSNSARDIRAISPQVGGSAATGFTLTARGLAEAAELIKEMTSEE